MSTSSSALTDRQVFHYVVWLAAGTARLQGDPILGKGTRNWSIRVLIPGIFDHATWLTINHVAWVDPSTSGGNAPPRLPPIRRRETMLPTLAAALALIGATLAPTAPAPHDLTEGIPWEFDFGEAGKKAMAANKPLLVYFWAEGSGQSVKLYSETLADEKVVAALTDEFICVSAKTNDAPARELAQRFSIQALPSLLVLTPASEPDDLLSGFIAAPDLLEQLARIRRGEKTLSWFKKRSEAEPDNLQARFDYAVQLEYLGNVDRHAELIDSIRADDPNGETEIGCTIALQDLQAKVFDGITDPADADLRPIYAFAENCRHQKLAFQIWNRLGNIEWQRDDKLKARQNMVKAWEIIPDEQVMDWGNTMAFRAWEQREDLPNQMRKLALKIAAEATKRAESLHGKGSDGGHHRRRRPRS